MAVSIRLLGGFEIRNGTDTVIGADWRPAKAAALVKILALQPGRTMHRDQLIDLLWPNADAEAGGSSFYKNVHHLRAAARKGGLDDLIVLSRGAVALMAGAELDTDAFRDLAKVAFTTRDVPAFEQAIAANGGELLPADLYEPWTTASRDEFRTLDHQLRLDLAERYLQRRRFDDAIVQYQAVLAANTLSEEAHRGLMRAFGASGQRALALAQYERVRDLLHTEIDSVPSDATEALVAEIRSVDRLTSPVDAAIAESVSAAEAAMRRRDWPAAIDVYRDAIDRLHGAGQDDEREAELWLQLSIATSATLRPEGVAEYARRAASLAEHSGALDLEARALVQFQAATDALPNNHAGHRESAELIAAAIERLPAGPTTSRARLLAASARPLAAEAREGDERHITGRVSIAGNASTDIEDRLREAVAIARTLNSPEVLAYTLLRLRTYITSPDTLAERVDITRDLLALQQRLRDPVSEYETHLFRHEDLLESGDLDGARIEARAVRRVGETIDAAGIVAVGLSCLATHATADGDLAEARRMLFESRQLDASYGNNANSQYRFGIQLLMIRWHQGRLEELYGPYRRAVDLAPRLNAARASLALICAETGRPADARAHLDHLARASVHDIPKDFLWWMTTIFMSRAAIATDAVDTATGLYALLQPYAGRNASTGGAISFGSAELILAQLAAYLGDDGAAGDHFECALAFNVRTRQRTWAAHTRIHYGQFLESAGDTANAAELLRIGEADALEFGIHALVAAP
jgi:DNA-binding SARP family transcriptional activator